MNPPAPASPPPNESVATLQAVDRGRVLASRAEEVRLIAALAGAALSLGFGYGAYAGVLVGIGRLFQVSAGALNWVNSIQLLATVVCVPVAGRLGDLFGHRRVLTGILAAVAVGAVLAATAPNFAVLLVGRALQGLIAGVLGTGPALVRERLSMSRGHAVIAALSGCLLIGTVAGLLAAVGFGSGPDGTRTVLWCAAGVYVVATVLCLVIPRVARSLPRAAARVDWLGVAVLAVGLAALTLGLRQATASGWSAAATLAYLAVGVVVLVAWTVMEARTGQPFIDVRAIVSRQLLPPCAIAVGFGIAEFGAQAAAITFMGSPRKELGYGFSMSVHDIGSWLIPCAIVGFVAAMVTSRLAATVGDRAAFLTGGALLALGFVMMLLWHQTTAEFVVALAVQYAGIGVTQAMVPTVLSASADPARRGVATSLGESLKALGGGLSTAAFATLEGSLVIAHTTIPTEHAYLWVWGICALVCAAFIPFALIRASRPRDIQS